MIACREPEEDLVETPGRPVPLATEHSVLRGEFWDDRTEKLLDSEKVRAARAEELRVLYRRVWVEADLEKCWNKKGRGPIGVRWVDVDKGFGVYRSRLVAKNFKPSGKMKDQEGFVRSHATFGVSQDAYPRNGARKQKMACRCEKGHVPRCQRSPLVCSDS